MSKPKNPKVILYYYFTEVSDPEVVMHWQRNLCERLNLKGRIIVSKHGINGTLGGDIDSIKFYKREMKASTLFKDMEFKTSLGTGNDFPKLSVKVRKELVTLSPEEKFDVFNSSTPLRPKAWKKYLEEHPNTIILDARNNYESNVGKFKGAVTPDINSFREIKSYLDELPKDQPILTYCTGDVRCEYLSAYMQHKGFPEVYHLEGGIVKYGQEFGEDEFWEGKCYTFDGRETLDFGNDIAACSYCQSATSHYLNCADKTCNERVLICAACDENIDYCAVHLNGERSPKTKA